MDPYPNSVIFDGSHLYLRRGGKVLVKHRSRFRRPSVSDERALNEGPLPQGVYWSSPQKKAREIDKCQDPREFWCRLHRSQAIR
jgi:hypothetical protein